ncbi:cysteine-rich motor neuron 1 protein-like isoform X2 [Thalassophryne amazonica]|uniref:cysteine-rich motor neuron 1 protein-like isoform X2 n=1 Tax=Thalassophryne amazonica TaxID=390379 RepID=UPI001471A312|nr:cysteine-rich motor neuron 1 protein-like isoform X2 [Thalassophryne amazonica]
MVRKCAAAFLNVLVLVLVLVRARARALSARECAPCHLRSCPQRSDCESGRTLASDPCGCCAQCSRLQWELCGGPDWTLGYCALGLTCASLNGTGPAAVHETGVCKALPDHPEAGLEDERCPLIMGCKLAGGQCVCDARHSCLGSFTYADQEACTKASKSEGPRRHEHWDRFREKYVGPSNPACRFSGCNLTAEGCVCESQSCHHHFAYMNRSQCQEAAELLRCAGVTCPSVPTPSCPKGSVLTKSYTPPAGCCPSVQPQCTCDLSACHRTQCPNGQQAVAVSVATGRPGDCCDVFECQKVPKCIHSGKQFSEGEVYRMEPCWLCRCRGGISFCSKAECAELDCENFYIPEGECCPVCIDVELLSVDNTEASCWVNNKLRGHEEQWKEDDCTFCQCVDGEPHCTAMACKQSCQNPVKIPGECCPFCEEPSYETVSPLLCPPLENCSLSGNDCPFGFEQDKNGCLLCRCLNNDSCPDLGHYCPLQCPMGYEKDDFGCEVCECSVPVHKCRPLTCSKTCPYGYVRNKHGCEMCRCVKCPPFTCDKHCDNGYRHNRKGCSICMCKESDIVPSATAPPPTPSGCLTSDGRSYEDGVSWHDGCRDCFCQSGREMCVLISCPVPRCSQPVVRPNLCCPTCDDESGSGQPEGLDMVVCRAPGGDFYVEGETWNLDECTRCTCRKGRVLCDTEVCPPALCKTPVRNKDTCCHICPEETLNTLLPVNSTQQAYCITSDGDVMAAGDSWKPNACTSCTCTNGTIQCFSQRCPAASCRVPVLRKGQCCPHCLKTTTSLPLTVSTGALKIVVTPTRRSTSWVTTVTMPTIITSADELGLGQNYPSQTQTALIYQSAAWILAGLLLAIVIFLIVALLNKKKKWVQMSCYSAPKKAVSLKKHINKNSVVYMEPSKENKFHNVKTDGGIIHFSPDMTTSCADKMTIPRAKLSMANDWSPC